MQVTKVSVELGSPFTANKFLNFHSDSMFDGRIDIRTTFPLNFSSSLYDSPESDTNSQLDDSEEDITEDVNEDTQCIYIPSTSPFYHPPPKARPFASSSSNVSFSCDALTEDGSFQKQPATSFCESLSQASDEWSEDEESKNAVCLHQKHDQDLRFSPVEIFEENRFGPANSVAIYLKVSEIAFFKPLPDVPRGIEFEYDYEEYDSESLCSSDMEEESKEFAQSMQRRRWTDTWWHRLKITDVVVFAPVSFRRHHFAASFKFLAYLFRINPWITFRVKHLYTVITKHKGIIIIIYSYCNLFNRKALRR
ncbi:hypothetical protein F5051DRAFT_75305 [Lentinula edodes]|nr:hypothetical protein F5051DRAFT_75305 [Lentinula edodes]